MTTTLPTITRPLCVHKSNCGRLGIIAGSDTYVGAAILATQAALRCGIGYVVVFSVPSVVRAIHHKCSEAIAIEVSQDNYLSRQSYPTLLQLIHEYTLDGLIIGPGLGRHIDTQHLIQLVVSEEWPSPLPTLIDADAIYALRHLDINQLSHIQGIFTPHPKEFETLTQTSISSRETAITSNTQSHPHVMLLKGAHTLVAQKETPLYTNQTGNPGMAVAGMGDVLSGCIGALMLQGASPFEATCLGVHIHGKASDIAFEKYHIGLTPTDVIQCIPEALAPFIQITSAAS